MLSHLTEGTNSQEAFQVVPSDRGTISFVLLDLCELLDGCLKVIGGKASSSNLCVLQVMKEHGSLQREV